MARFTATVGYVRQLEMRSLCLWCEGKLDGGWSCNHGGQLSVDGFPDDLPLAEIGKRLRCQRSGTKGRVDVRPDWREIPGSNPLRQPTADWQR